MDQEYDGVVDVSMKKFGNRMRSIAVNGLLELREDNMRGLLYP